MWRLQVAECTRDSSAARIPLVWFQRQARRQQVLASTDPRQVLNFGHHLDRDGGDKDHSVQTSGWAAAFGDLEAKMVAANRVFVRTTQVRPLHKHSPLTGACAMSNWIQPDDVERTRLEPKLKDSQFP